jgi:hypothetical protein
MLEEDTLPPLHQSNTPYVSTHVAKHDFL